MTHSLFIAMLALLTGASGSVLAMMVLKRRGAASQAETRGQARQTPANRAGNRSGLKTEKRRLIDDYAMPAEEGIDDGAAPLTALLAALLHDDDLDLGKICPSCGKRYQSQFRVCEQDNSDLAAVN